MSEPLKVGDTVWYIGNSGRKAEALPEDCSVRITNTFDGLIQLENGALLHATELRGYITVRKVEDFGTVGTGRYAIERKHTVAVDVPVRAFRNKEHWQKHVDTTRAWAKLLSRMQMHDQEDMEPFTRQDIEAAELALFGNIEP